MKDDFFRGGHGGSRVLEQTQHWSTSSSCIEALAAAAEVPSAPNP